MFIPRNQVPQEAFFIVNRDERKVAIRLSQMTLRESHACISDLYLLADSYERELGSERDWTLRKLLKEMILWLRDSPVEFVIGKVAGPIRVVSGDIGLKRVLFIVERGGQRVALRVTDLSDEERKSAIEDCEVIGAAQVTEAQALKSYRPERGGVSE